MSDTISPTGNGPGNSSLLTQLGQELLRAAGAPPERTNQNVLIPITEPDRLTAVGIGYPSTYRQWQWVFRHRTERGLERAFVRTGRRILVDVTAYLEAMRAQHNTLWSSSSDVGSRTSRRASRRTDGRT